MRRAFIASFALAFALAVGAPDAGAILGGTPDAGRHPNVGALVYRMDWVGPDGILEMYQACSGSLLSARSFLTAAHCVRSIESAVAAGWFTTKDVFVSFDEDLHATNPANMWEIFPEHLIGVDEWVAYPGTPALDVGIVRLAKPVNGIPPVELPSAELFDELAAHGGLRGHDFAAVGYGYEGLDRSEYSPNAERVWSGVRLVSISPFMALTRDLLFTQANPAATNQGGTCFGDSGGPHFFSRDGADLNLVVAIQSGGDATCQALNVSQRLDMPEVLAFLAPYAGRTGAVGTQMPQERVVK